MTAALQTAPGARLPIPTHHLPDELLIAYAAGSLDEANSLIVATHLTYCPECRCQAEALEAVGGAFLEEIEPETLSDGAVDKALAALECCMDEDAPVARTDHQPDRKGKPILPAPIQCLVGGDCDCLSWTGVGLGIQKAEIKLTQSNRRAFLMKVPAGRTIPMHTHDGTEKVLVLSGAYCVDGKRFGPGDLSISDDAVTHSPETDEREDCICLVVTDGRIRLTGFLGSILNRFVQV